MPSLAPRPQVHPAPVPVPVPDRDSAGAKRARVTAELERDASRSNRKIGEAAGTGHPFVAGLRSELEADAAICSFQFAGGRGARSGRHSATCTRCASEASG